MAFDRKLSMMARRNLNDLMYFVTIALEGRFTRAAALLDVTQSALSQVINALEAQLEIRLLNRTTRSVSPTAAGERLLFRRQFLAKFAMCTGGGYSISMATSVKFIFTWSVCLCIKWGLS